MPEKPEVLETSPCDQSLQALATATDGGPSPGLSSLAQDPELLGDFILEAREHLATIESQSMALEQNPADSEALHAIFRGFHTIKGLAGFLELAAIQQVSHEVEALLDLARAGKLVITPDAIDLVLGGADYLRTATNGIEAGLRGQAVAATPVPREVLARS